MQIHRWLYSSYNGYADELAWAAAMLFKATGEESYLADAKKYFAEAKVRGTCLLHSYPQR